MFGTTLPAGVVELEQDVANWNSEEVKEWDDSLLDWDDWLGDREPFEELIDWEDKVILDWVVQFKLLAALLELFKSISKSLAVLPQLAALCLDESVGFINIWVSDQLGKGLVEGSGLCCSPRRKERS
jgi:hypothetical protein